MNDVVNLGIIGLGRNWRQRYRRAVQALADRFHVVSVCDEIHERAIREARRLSCRPAAGPAELFAIADLHAVLLAESQWFGLWPIELACRSGKPVLCGVPLEQDDAHADWLHQQVREQGLRVLMALGPWFAPATTRLQRLLAEQLGPARLLLCEAAGVPLGTALIDWCVGLLGSQPRSVLSTAATAAGLNGVLLETEDGRAIQISSRAETARRSVRLHVIGEQATATVTLPSQLRWSDSEGRHALQVGAAGPMAQIVLERFHQVVTQPLTPSPSLEQLYTSLLWLRSAARSQREGRRVNASEFAALHPP